MSAAISKVRRPLAVVAASMLVLLAGSAFAKVVRVTLTGAEETPPVTTSAVGHARLIISEKDHTVRGSVRTTGIEGIAAHIHVGAPGEAGPPIIFLKKGPHGTWLVPPGAKLTDEQWADFTAGKLYINVHSAAHKSGEIRGQLKP